MIGNTFVIQPCLIYSSYISSSSISSFECLESQIRYLVWKQRNDIKYSLRSCSIIFVYLPHPGQSSLCLRLLAQALLILHPISTFPQMQCRKSVASLSLPSWLTFRRSSFVIDNSSVLYIQSHLATSTGLNHAIRIVILWHKGHCAPKRFTPEICWKDSSVDAFHKNAILKFHVQGESSSIHHLLPISHLPPLFALLNSAQAHVRRIEKKVIMKIFRSNL